MKGCSATCRLCFAGQSGLAVNQSTVTRGSGVCDWFPIAASNPTVSSSDRQTLSATITVGSLPPPTPPPTPVGHTNQRQVTPQHRSRLYGGRPSGLISVNQSEDSSSLGQPSDPSRPSPLHSLSLVWCCIRFCNNFPNQTGCRC